MIRLFLTAFVTLSGCSGSFLVKPKDTTALIGEDVILTCTLIGPKITTSTVQWNFGSCAQNASIPHLFNKRRVQDKHNSTYAVTGDQDKGQFNLRIKKATRAQAGWYICSDNNNVNYALAVVVILDSHPQCFLQSSASSVVARCTVNFTGFYPVQLNFEVGGIKKYSNTPVVDHLNTSVGLIARTAVIEIPHNIPGSKDVSCVISSAGNYSKKVQCEGPSTSANITTTEAVTSGSFKQAIGISTEVTMTSRSTVITLNADTSGSTSGSDAAMTAAIVLGLLFTFSLVFNFIFGALANNRKKKSKPTEPDETGNTSELQATYTSLNPAFHQTEAVTYEELRTKTQHPSSDYFDVN